MECRSPGGVFGVKLVVGTIVSQKAINFSEGPGESLRFERNWA